MSQQARIIVLLLERNHRPKTSYLLKTGLQSDYKRRVVRFLGAIGFSVEATQSSGVNPCSLSLAHPQDVCVVEKIEIVPYILQT